MSVTKMHILAVMLLILKIQAKILLLSKSNDFPLPPIKPLPQSSGDLPLPESSIPDLFSVYSCLRRFNNLLFLSPFSLDDFVGALNYSSANTLLDSVHICLLKGCEAPPRNTFS